jgi:hypothetical protein
MSLWWGAEPHSTGELALRQAHCLSLAAGYSEPKPGVVLITMTLIYIVFLLKNILVSR